MKLTLDILRQYKVIHKILIAVLNFWVASEALALEWRNGDWQVHGFLSQGFNYTDDNEVFGSSTDGSFDFTELGINGSVKLMPNLLISAQGLYRSTGASDTQGARLDFAQIDYSLPLLDSAAILGVRGGRVKIPFGLYNDTRDVVWTRPSVLLPQSIYFDTLGLRQAMISADGGMFYSRYNNGNHSFGLEFMVAEPQDDTGDAKEFLSGIPVSSGSIDGRPLFLGRAFYEWMGGRGKLMFSVVDLDRDYHSGSVGIPSGNVKVLYPLFSAQYNAERWSLTSEFGWIESDRTGGLPNMPTAQNFYLQGEYRLTEDWSAVLRYDVLQLDSDDWSGEYLSSVTGLPRQRFYARDLTAGVRWKFERNWMIAADYHYVNGTAWLNTGDNPDLNTDGGVRDWSLVTVMMSFRF